MKVALTEASGPLKDLLSKLDGENGSDTLEGLKKFLRGENPFPVIEAGLIDLDADPFVPDGWSVEGHKKGGQVKWGQTLVRLHLDKGQEGKGSIKGNKLRRELEVLSPYNANMLDFLLKKENRHLIPEEWKDKAVFFWGTIYRRADGSLCVRYLHWDGDEWGWRYDWLVYEFSSWHPAAVPASQN